MSTNDVPGANPANNDNLHEGCWAESANGDGSYIRVEGFENGRVIFEIFDTSKTPPVCFRDAMPEVQFKQTFSWNSKDPKSIKWTWHDKTGFPWSVLIQKGLESGSRPIFGRDAIAGANAIADTMERIADGGDADLGTAAQRVAQALGMRARDMTPDDLGKWRRAAGHFIDGIQRAINELGA